MMVDYMKVQGVLDRESERKALVVGKETPFRCVYKTRHGWSYTYHETYEDALNGVSESCGYSVMGHGWTQNNKKIRIEKEGPRGGWKKYTPETAQ